MAEGIGPFKPLDDKFLHLEQSRSSCRCVVCERFRGEREVCRPNVNIH